MLNEDKRSSSKVVTKDILDKPIEEYHIEQSSFDHPLAIVMARNTFEKIWPQLRFLKINTETSVLYFDGKPKTKDVDAFRFYFYVDQKQVLDLAKSAIKTYMSMSSNPIDFTLKLLSDPEMKISSYETIRNRENKDVVSIVGKLETMVLNPNNEKRICISCGFEDILIIDSSCPNCDRKIKWEPKK
tara:strand:- start:191 stop:748 length:558 start_codon:yes stop_codon:yes gene_type:complete